MLETGRIELTIIAKQKLELLLNTDVHTSMLSTTFL
jgi:hypothetical protein